MFGARILVALSLSLLVLPAQAASLTKEQVVEDLQYFRDVWAPKDRSFNPEARQQLQAFIDQQIAQARPTDSARLALVFAEAAAFSGNDHTLIYIYDTPDTFHPLPISFWWFPEGAMVTRAQPQYARLLGARIVSVGGVPIEQAAARVERFIPGIASHKRYISPLWLTRMEALDAIGVTRAGAARFDFVLASGQHVSETLGVTPTADPEALSAPWQAGLVPARGADAWPQVLDGLKELPPYLQAPDELSWKLLRDGALLYVRSTGLSSHKVEINGYRMIDTLVNSGHLPEAVVVDLRYNEGGDFFNVLSLATEIVKMTEPAGRIYVITGRATNSAAIIFTALLKGGAPERTRIVGEGISDHEWFWSEGGRLTAPASGLPLNYTDGYHDWAHGCGDVTKCYWPVVYHGVKAGSLSPDIPVDLTFKDYMLGKDPALEAALADFDAVKR